MLLDLLHIDAKLALVLGSKANHAEAKAPPLRLAQLDHGDVAPLGRVLNNLLETFVVEVSGLGVPSVRHQGAGGGGVRGGLRFLFSFSLALTSLLSRLGFISVLVGLDLVSARGKVEDQLPARSDVEVLWQD